MAGNFLQRVFRRGNEQRNNPMESPATPLTAGWQFLMGSGRQSEAGEHVDLRSSLTDATVFSCARVLAESVSVLPLRLLKVSDAGRQVAADENLHFLLGTQPNPEMTSIVWLEQQVLSLVLSGNAYSQIVRDSNGNPIEFWPLMPTQVQPMRDMQGNLVYKVNVNPEGAAAEYRVLPKEQILHTKLFGFNGLTGLSVVEMARQTIGASIAMTKHSSRLFRNGSVPSLVLKNKSVLPMSPESKTQAREDFETLMSGMNAHRLAIVDNDFDLEKMGYTAEESQWLQSKSASREDICGLFRVPLHLVGSLEKITNSNLELSQIGFYTQSLAPLLRRFEAEITSKCLPRLGGRIQQFHVEFDISKAIRLDSGAQSAFYTAGVQGGWLNPAEVRADLGYNPVPEEAGLTVYRTPVNYMSSALLVNQQAPETNPLPEPVIEGDSVNQRAAFSNYGAAYGVLFTDAVRRVVAGEPVLRACGPVVESLAESVAVNVGVEPDATRMVTYLTKLEGRASTWTTENVETVSVELLKSAVKTFVFGSHEDAAKKLVTA